MRSLLFVFPFALAACAQSAPSARPLAVPPPPSAEVVHVVVVNGVETACGVPSSRVVYDPATDNTELRALARCVAWGPLKRDTVELVAQRDPEMSATAGLDAGVRRAKAIEQFLVDEGVPRQRLIVESAREREAALGSGTFTSTRRVDVVLVAR